MKKKILLLFLLFFSFVALIGCDNTDLTGTLTTDEKTTEVTTEEQTSGKVTTEEQTTGETTTGEPTTGETTTGETTTSEPTTEEPTTEEPTTEEPTTEEPTTEEPTTEEPTSDDGYYDDYVDLSSVHSMADDTDLTVSGVVYFLAQNGYYIQDNTGNLFIFTNSAPNVELGDRVVVSGTLTTYRGVKQISNEGYVLEETNATGLDVTQTVHEFVFGETVVEPGNMYRISGTVKIEGDYSTAYLYQGTNKVAELYYKSLSQSVMAVKDYEGESITVDLLYYSTGDEVNRFAYQGDQSGITVEIPDTSEAILVDANLLPTEKSVSGDLDFGTGFYGSVYTITSVSGDISEYVLYEGSYLTVTQPEEEVGNVTGTVTIKVTLGDETPLVRTVNLTIRGENSTTIDMAYYDSAAGLSGQALLEELHDIINDGFKQMSYDDAKWVLAESDRDPNNSGNVILVYTRESVKGPWSYPTWNREHTWPQSKLTASGQKADMHNLKPADVQENSSRGNKPFGNVTSGSTYEPPTEAKGDVARILFYMATMYSSLNIESGVVGNLDMLLEWNELDPVDEFEMNRNEVIYGIQGNRNPFIDNPEFADLIWG